MSASTAISWCDSTVNFTIGCTKVSKACDNCYAEARMDKRLHVVNWGPGAPRQRTSAKYWRDALKMARKPFFECGACGWRGDAPSTADGSITDGLLSCPTCDSMAVNDARRRIFSLSLGDWLDNEIPIAWFVDMLDVIRQSPESDWLLLTKRIGNWKSRLGAVAAHLANEEQVTERGTSLGMWVVGWLNGTPPPNVWIGSTVINQNEADRDVPKLLSVPARVRFLSIEPMLGPITLDLDRVITMGPGRFTRHASIDWIICGGESGPHARPMHPDWVRGLRDQCAAAGVPFHFKQWGEWAEAEAAGLTSNLNLRMRVLNRDGTEPKEIGEDSTDWECLHRFGKETSGRHLDGVEHNAFPAVSP